LNIRIFLTQPFSVLDLCDVVQTLKKNLENSRPQNTVSRLRTETNFNARNAALLTRLWAMCSSGILRIHDNTSNLDNWVTLSNGGLVGRDGWPLLQKMLQIDVELSFDEQSVQEAGDRSRLGQELFSLVRDPGQRRFASEHKFDALAPTGLISAAMGLQITEELRQILALANGQVTLGELMARINVSPESVGADLHALKTLNLVTIQPPVSKPRKIRGNERAGRVRKRRDNHASRVVSNNLNPASQSVSSVSQNRALKKTSSPQIDVVALRKRLTRELNDLKSAKPANVLGVPSDADIEVIDEIASRMDQFYQGIVQNSSLPVEVRQMARSVQRLVTQAHKRLGEDAQFQASAVNSKVAEAEAPPPNINEKDLPLEERLLLRGELLIGSKNWEKADQVLSQAHKIRIDHPKILALLGWSRFKNPTHDKDKRTSEARDLLSLAVQFDPKNAHAQFYLSQIFLEQGEKDLAFKLVERAVRLQPGEQEFRRCLMSMSQNQG